MSKLLIFLLRTGNRNKRINSCCPIESPPSQIDDLLLDLEDPAKANATIKRILLPKEAGWLARAVREKCMKDRERMHDEIERDLNVCIPGLSALPFILTLSEIYIAGCLPATRCSKF